MKALMNAHHSIPALASVLFCTLRIAGGDLGHLDAVAQAILARRHHGVAGAAAPDRSSARPSSVSPTVTGRCCTVPSGCDDIDQRAALPCCRALSGTVIALCCDRAIRRTLTNSPGQRARLALGKVALSCDGPRALADRVVHQQQRAFIQLRAIVLVVGDRR